MEMQFSFDDLTEREKAIFQAGQLIGAAQATLEIAEHHRTFVQASAEQAAKRNEAGQKMLKELPLVRTAGGALGSALGRRVRGILGGT